MSAQRKHNGVDAARRSIKQARFTPAELADMTGLSTDMQRVWRRRDQLPEGEGSPARFSAIDAAEVMIRYELSRFGVPPGDSAEVAKKAASMVLWFALLGADGACEVFGQERDVEQFLAEFADSHVLAAEMAGATTLARYIWRTDGDEVDFVSDLQEAGTFGDFLSGFFIDLEHAGTRMAEIAGRPLLTVEIEPIEGQPGKRVRRLTGHQEVSSLPS